MIQAIIRKGQVFSETIPAPAVSEGSLLIKVVNSCISAGTEGYMIRSSSKSTIRKSLENPEKVKKFFKKLKENGFAAVYGKVKQMKQKDEASTEMGMLVGYSISGIVVAVGKGVEGFKPGDAVAAAGAGRANHAEFVDVPVNLVMKKPEGASYADASTVAIGSIALQGIRRAAPQAGEFCVVFGLGIIGLITLQILESTGMRPIVVDIDPVKLDLARKQGAEMVLDGRKEGIEEKVIAYTGGHGADAVLFCAATESSEPLSVALKMLRRKGRLVLVGTSGNKIKREDLYYKEIDFLISTSYGPGRYDDSYEEKGIDYPYSYVRWTENRNMQEYLRMIASGAVSFEEIETVSFPIEKADEAFSSIKESNAGLKLVYFEYGDEEVSLPSGNQVELQNRQPVPLKGGDVKVALVGIGGFAMSVHLPNLNQLSDLYKLSALMNDTGPRAKVAMEKYGARYSTTDFSKILMDDQVDLVMLCTTHKTHASMSLQALRAGKHVFVEKPMAISLEELDQFREFYNEEGEKPVFMTGFNRRFSPYLREIKKHTEKRINPMMIHYRMNAGRPPDTHWLYTEGGRIIGEGCHILDLFSYLTGSRIKTIYSETIVPQTTQYHMDDNRVISLTYEDGSVAVLSYFATGSKHLSKEYMEVHFDGSSIIMDDYKSMKGFGLDMKEMKTQESEKGHREELEVLHRVLSGKQESWPISLESMLETTEATIRVSG
jgi:predicted dehydrogenase/threonine dehydrogenase-like Zn-dependent dehydrogenase